MAKPTKRTSSHNDVDESGGPVLPKHTDVEGENGAGLPPKRPRKPKKPPVAPPPYETQPRLHLAPEEILADDTADLPKNDKEVLNKLFGQAMERWTKKKDASKGVELISDVVSRIQSGQPLSDLQVNLGPLLNEQSAKASVVQSAILNHQLERLALHFDMRWFLERDLWQELREMKLNAAEKLVLLKLSCIEADKAAEYINNANPNFQLPQDIEATVDKATKSVSTQATALNRKEFEGTTPQGREVIRRLTFKAKQAANKIIETKKTNGTKSDDPPSK